MTEPARLPGGFSEESGWRRWRESAAAGGVASLGVALLGGVFSGPLGVTPAGSLVGAALALGGAGWLLVAWRRARLVPPPWQDLARERGGAGIVAVREGAVGYFGPHGGGVMALDQLARVDALAPLHPASAGAGAPAMLENAGRPAEAAPATPSLGAWRLTGRDGGFIVIPARARGHEELVEALLVLPGFRSGMAEAVLEGRGEAGHDGMAVVWEQPAALARRDDG